jgi:hypothetical protein
MAKKYRTRSSLWSDHIQLPDIASNTASDVLDCIAPYLQDIKLEGGQCFRIAQQLTLAANSSRVKYVEGGWGRAPSNPQRSATHGDTLVYHAWNLVDGHIVDLTAELYHWNSFGADSPWIHKPLHQYAVGDLHHFESKYCQGCDAISSHIGSNEIYEGMGISFGIAHFLVDNLASRYFRDFHQDFLEWQKSGVFSLLPI